MKWRVNVQTWPWRVSAVAPPRACPHYYSTALTSSCNDRAATKLVQGAKPKMIPNKDIHMSASHQLTPCSNRCTMWTRWTIAWQSYRHAPAASRPCAGRQIRAARVFTPAWPEGGHAPAATRTGAGRQTRAARPPAAPPAAPPRRGPHAPAPCCGMPRRRRRTARRTARSARPACVHMAHQQLTALVHEAKGCRSRHTAAQPAAPCKHLTCENAAQWQSLVLQSWPA